MPGVSWAVSLSLSLWTCDTGHWLSEGVSNPSPAPLEDFIFCWLLLGPFPEFSVADGLRPSDRRILLRQVLMNVWNFFSVTAVVLHVSAPSSRTGFTVVLEIPILMLMVRLGEDHMFFIWRRAALALPFLTFTSGRHKSPPPSPSPPLVCQQCYLGR